MRSRLEMIIMFERYHEGRVFWTAAYCQKCDTATTDTDALPMFLAICAADCGTDMRYVPTAQLDDPPGERLGNV